MSKDLLQIATIGKVVGLWGDMKLHLQSDFENQFVSDAEFTLTNGKTIKIETFKSNKSLVKFYGYNSREDARVLTNQQLFTTEEETRENCKLDDGQFFWFDIVGSHVYDNELCLGSVKEVERIGVTDYLIVKTSDELVKKELSKSFYIPYIDNYIDGFNQEEKIVKTKDALLLLEAS